MKLLTLDFETHWDADYSVTKMTTSEYLTDPRYKTLGLSIKVDGGPTKYTTRVDDVLRALASQIEDNAVLAHHAHFDGFILAHHYGIKPAKWFDTLSMARALHGVSVGGSLQKLSEHYALGSKKPLTPQSTPQEVRERALQDVDLTYALLGKMIRGYPRDELELIDLTIRMFTEPMLELESWRVEALIEKIHAASEKRMADLGVTSTMLNSGQQFADLLRAEGVEPPTKVNDKGEFIFAFAKTDKEFTDLETHENPTVQALVAARLGAKSTGEVTRAKRFVLLHKRMTKLPVYLNYYGAHPGRWSGADGTNFQNLKRGGALRKALIAPEGHAIVVGDLAQIEARANGWLCEDKALIKAFSDGRDIYCDFGPKIFDREVTKETVMERFVSKTAILGLGFGCGWERFRDEVRAKSRDNGDGQELILPPELCKKTVDVYRQERYKIVDGWNTAETLLHPGATMGPLVGVEGGIRLPNGMMIRYPELRKVNGRKWLYRDRNGKAVHLWGGIIIQNVIEGLCRIIIAEQMLELARRAWKIVLSTHDEIALCVPYRSVDQARREMESVMLMKPKWAAGLPLATEIGSGISYGDAK